MTNAFKEMTDHAVSLLLIGLVAGLAFAADPPTLSKAEVKELIAKASTPEDHHRLATYFTQKADNMEAEAVEHEELAQEYGKHPEFTR